MSEPARHLRVIDEDGVVQESCPGCARKSDEIQGLQRDIRSWAYRYAELKRDKEADAEQSRHWPAAKEVFDYWRQVCNHPRSTWNAERFFIVEPFIKKHGVALCKRAIDGAAFDPFTTTRKNGSTKRHDGWDLVFRSADKFEEFCNRAPRSEAG